MYDPFAILIILPLGRDILIVYTCKCIGPFYHFTIFKMSFILIFIDLKWFI